MAALYELVAQYRELERFAESDDIEPQALKDTLEGLTGNIEDKAKNVGAFIGNLEASATAIRDAAAKMIARAVRLEHRSAAVRDYLFTNMKAAGISKIECPYFVLAIRKNPPKVVIDNDELIPETFMVQPPAPPPHADKKAILDELKTGNEVPGVHMEQGERLDIRV